MYIISKRNLTNLCFVSLFCTCHMQNEVSVRKKGTGLKYDGHLKCLAKQERITSFLQVPHILQSIFSQTSVGDLAPKIAHQVTPSNTGIYLLCFVMQMEMDVENPACVIDGLILQQLNEIRSTGKSEIFTDDMLGALCFNVFEGGK